MVQKKINKILYILFFVFLSICTQSAYAADTVSAEDSEPKKEEKNAVYVNLDNPLGSDYHLTRVEAGRPEMHIKNPFDYMREKRQKEQKAANAAFVQSQKKDDGLTIDCDEMEYFEDRSELEARGNVVITTPDGVKVNADKAIYNKENNTIRLYDKVVMVKDSTKVEGDYMMIDLNEENALMDEPVTNLGTLRINAKEGYAYSDRIEEINGNIELNQRVEMELHSQGFLKYGRAVPDTRLVDFSLKKERSKPYKLRTKEIIIRPERDHDSILMQDVDVYYHNRKIANVPSMEIFFFFLVTYTEMNFPPEFGSLKGFGMYAGLGYTFKLPKTYTFRATPAITYGEDELGVGIMGILKSDRMKLEGGWSTSTTDLILNGEYKLTDKFDLSIGRHAYKGEWFNGGNRAGYIAELIYDDSYLMEDLGNTVFRHRISAGYVADYRREHQEDNMHDGMRYRYMAQLSKALKTFGSKEQDMYLTISAVAQGMATVYSETGDTFGMVRVGPSIESRLKRWNSRIMYTVGGVHGHTPYYFDEYRYGRQTISFDESLILNRFLSVGYRGTLTPLKDNRKGDLVTENRIYAVVGPEDFKVAFSYDTIRQNMHFDFLFLLGSDNLDLRYEKLNIEHPDKLGKHQRKLSDRELYRVKVPENL